MTVPNAGEEETGSLVHYLWECKMVHSPWKRACHFILKLKMSLPYDPAITLLNIHPREMKTFVRTEIYTRIS